MKFIIVLIFPILFTACIKQYDYDLQGHRGARGLVPENTISGFLEAIDHGVDTVELDVVVTADDKLLVSHEPWFNHQISTKPDGTPVSEEEETGFNIYEMTYDETIRFDVGLRRQETFPDQQLMEVSKPLLVDAIIAIEEYVEEQGKNPVHYNIETKSQPEWYGEFTPHPEEFTQLLYDELSELGVLDRVIIQSFDPATLVAMRRIDPTVTQAMLVYENINALDPYINLLGYTPEIWSPFYEHVTPELVAEIHERGMTIIPWTINETEEMVRLLDMGVDGIITDYPNRAPR
ncbi:MAG: glycerophosphodiester phosphodiesterase family protein [Balneolaceae bacterium]